MSIIKTPCATLLLSFLFGYGAFAQWVPVDSGTSNNLNGTYLLDSGVGFAVGDAGTILKSTDSGATWSGLTSGTTRSLYDVYFFADAEGVAVGDNGLILRTTNGGASWQSVASGVRDTLRAVSFSGANGICGATSQTILYSTDSGASWQISQSGFFGGGFFGAHMISSTTGFVAGENSIFQPLVGSTTDGGASWTFHNFYFNGNEGSCDDIFFFDQNTGVTSGVVWDGEGSLSRTTNGGTDWTTSLYPQGMQGIDFPKTDAGFAVGWSGTILKSIDAGITWAPQTSGTSVDLHDVHFAADALTGIAVGDGGTILRTTNGGGGGTLTFDGAFSEMGPWDIVLPADGSGIEDRRGGPTRKYSIYLVFNNTLASVASATTSCGTVTRVAVDNENTNQIKADLSGVTCNESEITVTANGVVDEQGNSLSSVSISFGLLVGDVTGDGMVDRADYRAVKNDLGQPADAGNFREDVATIGHNSTGYINASDLNLVKRQQGTRLPR